jgi:hypothetical protein
MTSSRQRDGAMRKSKAFYYKPEKLAGSLMGEFDID